MTLPILLSVSHAGLWMPPEIEDICVLSEEEIRTDGDEGAAEIYLPLESEVHTLVTTPVARAIIDMNRAEDDFRKDGIIKTHTCWDIPIYTTAPSSKQVRQLLDNYYHPFHAKLSASSPKVKVGIDCHTMAAKGPPVGPDPGKERPAACVANADGTCPSEWIESFASIFQDTLGYQVAINHPFKGGYIIRSHSSEIPWFMVEFSRSAFLPDTIKSKYFISAIRKWIELIA